MEKGLATPVHSAPAKPARMLSPLTTCLTYAASVCVGIALSTMSTHYGLLGGKILPKRVHDRVGRLPVMGYNTWNAYHCNINETVLLQTADLMTSLGLAVWPLLAQQHFLSLTTVQDSGYKYINIDDCYSEKKRNEAGDIVADPKRFPSGLRAFTDHVHSLGLKAGIYSDAGWFTCALYPGSFQNEERDVKRFGEEWGFDLLKYDNCAVPFDEITRENIYGRYKRMSDAIAAQSEASGKLPLELALCEWGRVSATFSRSSKLTADKEQPWLWARTLGSSWRTTTDITPNWKSVANIINQNSFISWASDFYGHGDMDMLEVGNGDLTYEEAKTHFTVWALLKSPLLIGTHLADISDETLSILKNEEIIAINQDPVVGTALVPFRWGLNPNWTPNATHPAQYWSGQSENGTVFMLINTLNEEADMFFNLTESPWIRAGRQYSVRDLWSHTLNGTAIRNITASRVPAHGVVALLLQDAGDEPEGMFPKCAVGEWSDFFDGLFSGKSRILTRQAASRERVV
ncbi:Alpha-galactosidase [Mycena indigotica]|uniref:Alpha-galactosidase n=1 Tax=Mycena indigotica TaxID=2126181 RepID=A0A8H6TBE8_9AGAR|nr:Alpha-galactosidase [Mycena indigotica]KAF7312760.1 Alpha-galactosidase [Mycena indigotica]